MESDTSYELSEYDLEFIEKCIGVVRRLLSATSCTPQQIIGIGLVLNALERLPQISADIYVVLSLSVTNGDENFREMKYFSFEITDYFIDVSKGGSVYTKEIGSDSFSYDLWHVDSNGVREEYLDQDQIFYEMNLMIDSPMSISVEYELPIPEIDLE